MNVKNLKSVKLTQMSAASNEALSEFYESFDNALKREKIDIVVIEDYILFADKVGPQLFQEQPTSQVIGAIKYIASQNGVSTKLQRSSEAKTYTNKVLNFPLWGFIKDKKILNESITGKRHAMDSFRHTVVFVQKIARKNFKKK